MAGKGNVVDGILKSVERAWIGCSVCYCTFLILSLLNGAQCQNTAAWSKNLSVRRVYDSAAFFTVVTERSADIIELRNDVKIRNYYGWVLPNNSGKRIGLEGSLQIRSPQSSSRRMILDLDGISVERMISGVVEFSAHRLHLTQVMATEYADMEGIQPHVTLNDSIVEVSVHSQSGDVSSLWESLNHKISRIDEGKWHVVDNYWCGENYGIECSDGGVYFFNSSVTFKSGSVSHGTSTWIMHNTLIKFVEVASEKAAVASNLLLAISMQVDLIYIPYDFTMEASACNKSPIQRNTTIQDPGRPYPPSLVMDFKREVKCISIDGVHSLRMSDIIVRNVLYYQWWPDMLPLVIGNQSTIILENAIIELDIDQSYHEGKLNPMILELRKLNRVPGLGSGAQMVEEWGPEDCEEYQKRSIKCRDQNRCSPEAKCPLGAIFVEDASFALSDLYGVDKAGTKYHVIHSLFTVVTYYVPPPTPPSGNQLSPKPLRTVGSESNSTRQELLPVILVSVIGVLVLIIGVCTVQTIRHRRRMDLKNENDPVTYVENKFAYAETRHGSGPPDKISLDHPVQWSGSTRAPVSKQLVYSTTSRSDARDDRDYQIAANKLLGSVTLGPLLGMGSFGRVYKGTWNGATCAVKVISHARGNSAEAFAHREAGISTDLHHPNVVQTFIKTTRTFEGSRSTRSVELSSNGSLESARSSIDSFEDAKENGYVEISKMSPHVKKTTGSSGNRSTSFRGSDNQEENWECMSAMSVGMETWLVQEWCEMGSLDRQVERGLFMIDSRHLDMLKIVDTCLDICRGMTYLKNKNLIHGDLKTSNVLLSGSLGAPKGFLAKVADFGLSRELTMNASHIKTRTTGTVTHMPPELFKEERLTIASDVYSFGILMWELVSGEPPLAGVPHFVVMKKILLDNWRPTFPEDCPGCYQALAQQCWDSNAVKRPSFEMINDMLLDMHATFTGSDPGRTR